MPQALDQPIEPSPEEGASAVEYALLVTGIAALIVLMVFVFGGAVHNSFSDTCGKVSSAVATGNVDSSSCS